MAHLQFSVRWSIIVAALSNAAIKVDGNHYYLPYTDATTELISQLNDLLYGVMYISVPIEVDGMYLITACLDYK